jgi:hypothetical protein
VRRTPWLTALGLLLGMSAATPAVAAGTATFALVIGTNGSVDQELEPLRYADDDAARYFDLFRSLGTRTYLLSNLDEDTARLHPQAEAEAEPPRGNELDALVGLLKGNVAIARARGLRTVFYFVYAGHGNVKDNKGYITLEDERLYGDDVVERILGEVGADDNHLIVDACYSFFLAYGRGPGGKRREVAGFAKLQALAQEGEIGLILSTSSAAESHEWEAFQAGVFSHEIRSALYGAADADGDGVVTYREVASFVSQANATIPNEKFRPKLHARPPAGSGALLDLRNEQRRVLEIDGKKAGRYQLEDHDGVRLVDFHSGPGQSVTLVRTGNKTLYLKAPDDDVEYEVPPVDKPVRLAALTPQKPRVQGRGAAHNAFSKIFERPFDTDVVGTYRFAADEGLEEGSLPWASMVSIPVMGAGAVLMAVGAGAALVAAGTYLTAGPQTPQTEIVQRNQIILAGDAAAVGFVALGVAALAAGGAIWWFWPEEGP